MLNLTTNPNYDDRDTMYAAGYLESFLTAEQIHASYVNTMQGYLPLQEQIYAFLKANDEYVALAMRSDTSSPAWYWQQVALVMRQFDGLFDGYKHFSPKSAYLDRVQLLSLSANGDVSTLMLKYNLSNAAQAAASAHCSGLVKVTDDLSELFIGHTTWAAFNTMLRLIRTTNFPLHANRTATARMSFSSYPGYLTSTDDFFTTESGLAVIETTNGNYNHTLFDNVMPTTGVLSWVRTLVATRVATSGASWIDAFFVTNSKTYNNQWIVLDFNLFVPGQALAPGLLWIAEQYPNAGAGYLAADVTDILAFGYWPSYNVPYFPEVYAECNFPAQVQQYGPQLCSYDLAARAQIFRRNESAVASEADFASMMRYNNWLVDPLSEGNAGLAISSRFDLVNASTTNPLLARNTFGGIDSKYTSFRLMSANGTSTGPWAGAFMAQSGPTHDQQPPFSVLDWPHSLWLNMPAVFDFDWVAVNPVA